MRFDQKDPDIATIMRRIYQNIYDLQPDFQRGEVWTTSKKQRLIDSVLRKWHIPPIHLVDKGEGRFDVLDGQQRLTAIRDFVNGIFPVDGSIEPFDANIAKLSGLRYSELPDGVRNEFDNFSVSVFQLTDYDPQEPYELFFRLNQPTNLTEAEKRNAFIGGPRNQVKELVDWAVNEGMHAGRIGFSNARMSYDDLLARFLITLDQGTLLEKVTSAKITSRYRENAAFSESVLASARASMEFFLHLPFLDSKEERLRPNKATIHTWLCMAAKLHKHDLLTELRQPLTETVHLIERSRLSKRSISSDPKERPLTIFHDRSTSRVADTSSVMLRDLTAWMIFVRDHYSGRGIASFLDSALDAWQTNISKPDFESALSGWAAKRQWGGAEWL